MLPVLEGQGDSSAVHCASLLCMIFASLARTKENVHVHNEKNVPYANSEINVCFLLNSTITIHIILFKLKKISALLYDTP